MNNNLLRFDPVEHFFNDYYHYEVPDVFKRLLPYGKLNFDIHVSENVYKIICGNIKFLLHINYEIEIMY